MRTETGEQWELHLKASRDKMFLFGYLCKHDALTQIVKDSVNVLLSQRRLPLVLDLDDTLVRAVGDEGSKRQVPEKDLLHCKYDWYISKDTKLFTYACSRWQPRCSVARRTQGCNDRTSAWIFGMGAELLWYFCLFTGVSRRVVSLYHTNKLTQLTC